MTQYKLILWRKLMSHDTIRHYHSPNSSKPNPTSQHPTPWLSAVIDISGPLLPQPNFLVERTTLRNIRHQSSKTAAKLVCGKTHAFPTFTFTSLNPLPSLSCFRERWMAWCSEARFFCMNFFSHDGVYLVSPFWVGSCISLEKARHRSLD